MIREIPDPKILLSNEETHVVLLSEKVRQNTNEYSQEPKVSIEVCTVIVSEDGARITRMDSEFKPESFVLSLEEMDALCKTWIGFNSKRENATEAEKDREMIDEAYAISEAHPEIILVKNDNGWRISAPGIASYVARSPQAVLYQVKCALDLLHTREI